MQYGSHTHKSPQAMVCIYATKVAHAVRGFSNSVIGCVRGRVCAACFAQNRGTCIMGAGSAFAKRGWRPLSTGPGRTTGDPGRFVPASGCALGDGRRVALQGPKRRDRRSVGRSGHIGFYCNQAAGAAGRASPDTLLAYPSCGVARSECGAQSLACCLAALTAAPGRSQGSGNAALAGRAVSLARPTTRHMGGDL